MKIQHSTIVSIITWSFAVIFNANVIAKDIPIYRWVDENNVVHFSQHEPQKDNYSQLTSISSYRASEKQAAKPTELPSETELLSQYEQNKEQALALNKSISAKNCQAAQLNEKMLNTLDTVMVIDAKGQNKALSNKEKAAQLAVSQEHISLYCTKDDTNKG